MFSAKESWATQHGKKNQSAKPRPNFQRQTSIQDMKFDSRQWKLKWGIQRHFIVGDWSAKLHQVNQTQKLCTSRPSPNALLLQRHPPRKSDFETWTPMLPDIFSANVAQHLLSNTKTPFITALSSSQSPSISKHPFTFAGSPSQMAMSPYMTVLLTYFLAHATDCLWYTAVTRLQDPGGWGRNPLGPSWSSSSPSCPIPRAHWAPSNATLGRPSVFPKPLQRDVAS